MSLVSFFLATHANAALAGLPVRFGEKENEVLRELLWNSPGIDWGFYVPGPRGDRLRLDPNAWVETMHASGIRRTTFSFGPSRELAGDGLLAEGGEERWYYQCLYRKLEDRRDQILLKGRSVQVEFTLTLSSVSDAAKQLASTIEPMISFADRYSGLAWQFSSSLTEALGYARKVGTGAGLDEVAARVRPLYPASVYPVDHQLLMSATLNSSILGGMGSWNDFGPDPADRHEYDLITKEFASALYPAYTVASYLDLTT